MKTTVFLHGGYAGHVNEKNDTFFSDILKDTSQDVKVLIVLFSKETEKVEENMKEDIAQFERNKGSKNISCTLADEGNFLEQVKDSDIIYFHGGNTLKLLNTLKKFPNLKELFKGKVIAGESAGAYALSKHFYSIREGGVFEGLGIIPVETVCHYTEERSSYPKELPGTLETLLLPDYEYKVFEY